MGADGRSRMRSSCFGTLLSSMLALGACGGEPAHPAETATGVDGSKLLIDITDEDAQAFCTYAGRVERDASSEAGWCVFNGPDGEGTCEQRRDACIASDAFERWKAEEGECGRPEARYYIEGLDDSCKIT